MRTTAKVLAALAVVALTSVAARADSWGISIGGGSYGGGFGFHYSTGSGTFVAAAPVYVTPAPVYVTPAPVCVAPAPVKVCGPQVIHVSPQVITHRSWRHGYRSHRPVCAPPPRVCVTPRPVVVVAGCR